MKIFFNNLIKQSSPYRISNRGRVLTNYSSNTYDFWERFCEEMISHFEIQRGPGISART